MTVHDSGNNTLTIQITRGDPSQQTIKSIHMQSQALKPNMWTPPDDEEGDRKEEEEEDSYGDGKTETKEQSILFVDRLFGELTTEERAQVMLYKQILDASSTVQ